MKQLLFFLFFVQFSAIAQCDTSNVVNVPDVDAQFPGGPSEMLKFIRDNIEYPEITRYPCEQFTGRIFLKFIICDDGTVEDIECIRCSSTEYDQIAIDVVEKMPKWIPAKVNGKPVASFVRLPITIHLQ